MQLHTCRNSSTVLESRRNTSTRTTARTLLGCRLVRPICAAPTSLHTPPPALPRIPQHLVGLGRVYDRPSPTKCCGIRGRAGAGCGGKTGRHRLVEPSDILTKSLHKDPDMRMYNILNSLVEGSRADRMRSRSSSVVSAVTDGPQAKAIGAAMSRDALLARTRLIEENDSDSSDAEEGEGVRA